MKTITICAKCSDMFNVELRGAGEPVMRADGYVPEWFPNPNVRHYGDYVQLDIDLDTGKILNWKKPTQAQLDETFKKDGGE